MKRGLIISVILGIILAFIKFYVADYSINYKVDNYDIKTEYKILKNIKREYKNISLILITHRNNNNKLFNKIYTLENGRLIKNKEVKWIY